MDQKIITKYLKQIRLPGSGSHKGQNGKLLIIGGSELFHAASKWSLDVASKFVDMIFYSSVEENNELIKKIKNEFWNGIVVPRKNLQDYIGESDCILIGPGMDRSQKTQDLVNKLLNKYQNKKWVVDAGALQMVNPSLLQKNHIITPHQKELIRLEKNGFIKKDFTGVMLITGEKDVLTSNQKLKMEISGGNSGMTKGGTGDVLAGLIAALYCTHDAETAAVVGSYINKKAGEKLAEKVGPYFNASDLVEAVPETMWDELKKLNLVKN